MATCEFCADELPEGVRFCPSCGASAGGGTRCPRCSAANALMAIHCNQCGASLAENLVPTEASVGALALLQRETEAQADPRPLPEWLLLEEEPSAPAAEPPEVTDLAPAQEPLPTVEVASLTTDDLAAALRELARDPEPAPSPPEEPSSQLSGELAAALQDIALDLPPAPQKPPIAPRPAEDLDAALRELLGQPSPSPEPSPQPRLEEEGEFYRWLEQAMQDRPPEGEGGRVEGGG